MLLGLWGLVHLEFACPLQLLQADCILCCLGLQNGLWSTWRWWLWCGIWGGMLLIWKVGAFFMPIHPMSSQEHRCVVRLSITYFKSDMIFMLMDTLCLTWLQTMYQLYQSQMHRKAYQHLLLHPPWVHLLYPYRAYLSQPLLSQVFCNMCSLFCFSIESDEHPFRCHCPSAEKVDCCLQVGCKWSKGMHRTWFEILFVYFTRRAGADKQSWVIVN